MSSLPQSMAKLVKMSHGFFADTPCTPDTLTDYLDCMGSFMAKHGLDREEAYDLLERTHTIKVLDSASILEDHGDHIDWFNPSTREGLKRDIGWHFSDHFRDYLSSGKGWPKGIVDSIDQDSSKVLALLEDPKRSGTWDRRGMVMGSVQSGKTANYTSLICKAIDAGYTLIVVLAGVHNSLRSQTQYRLNEEVLGYDLDRVHKFDGQGSRIGVRTLFREHRIVQTLTSSSENGDFNRALAEQAGMIPGPDGPPILMVIKKHVNILENLIDWATHVNCQEDDRGRKIVTNVPLLVIDDECDYASVNTKKVKLNDDGLVDEDCDPTRTNLFIRKLLNAFRKSAYVGYTATPFANIFIHHALKHQKHGEDLFPRNFIINLPQPTNYVGPTEVFGLAAHPEAGIEKRNPSRLIKYVKDSEPVIPAKHKKDLVVGRLPESMEEAIRSFIISCAMRRLRQSSPVHNSMLIHVTRFTMVQEQVKSLVEKSLQGYVNRIRSGSDPLEDFQDLWQKDFEPVTKSLEDELGVRRHRWKDIRDSLFTVARRIKVALINGSSEDTLSYRHAELAARRRVERGETVPWEERGEHVIAIGGDKLSRGLTLDGLTVSYYLRASKMYDTLMQMGRWFGYRDGYLDACRIYTTRELVGWYRFIASASIELKQELDYMSLINDEPKDFGLKVLDHPGQLAITSAGKRRNTETIKLSYSGRISETIVFDLTKSANNLEALAELIRNAGGEGQPGLKNGNGIFHRSGVSPDTVIAYLNRYKTHEEAVRVVDPLRMAEFIEKQQEFGDGDLTEWDVAVVSRKQDPPHILSLDGRSFGCFERYPADPITDEFMSIGRLVNPPDEWIDFDEEKQAKARLEWERQREENKKPPPNQSKTPSGMAIRATRPKNRGLLLVYPICFNEPENRRYGMQEGQEVTGFAISFPGSKTTRQVSYVVNSVFIDEED